MMPKVENQIAVVVVNWNRWQLTLQCLSALQMTNNVSWHLYLVDNASTDESLANLQNLGSDVTLIASPINGGWTGGNNIGIKQALANNHQYIFILNNDAVVKPETLQRLLAYQTSFDKPPVLGPIQRTIDGKNLSFIGSDIDPNLGLPRLIPPDEAMLRVLPDSYPVSYIRGAGIFAHREHFSTMGLFDERYFLNYDESDWCFRARQKGYQVLMLKSAEILHEGSATIGGGYSALNRYFMTRNGLLFAETHCDRKKFFRLIAEQASTIVRMSPQNSRIMRAINSITTEDAAIKATRAGFRDYFLRRFGDCPAFIRTM